MRAQTNETSGAWGTAIDALSSVALSRYISDLESALRAGRIRQYTPLPYYRRRQDPLRAKERTLRGEALIKTLLSLLVDFDRNGYFDDAFGSSCSDASWDERVERSTSTLQHGLGEDTPWRWPPDAEQIRHLDMASDDALSHAYDLLELGHDLAARPRTRDFHSFFKEWDFSDFDHLEGRMVYRWRVNTVLERTDTGLRLSKGGPDEGRLVRTPSDPRGDLPALAVLAAPTKPERDQMQHAISQFTNRTATRHDKRDALRNLAGLLEQRREEAEEKLGSQDSRDLFHIVNKFDIRHQGKMQSGNYEDAYLDWIFWSLLSSLELMGSLSSGGHGSTPTAQSP